MSSNTGGGISLLAEAYVLGPNSTTSRLYMFDLESELSSDLDDTVPIAPISVPFIPGNLGGGAHNPLDTRSSKVRRSSRRGYRKAVKHYGKTYTFTKSQVLWAMAIVLGLVVMLSSFLFTFYIHFAQTLGVIQ